MFPPLREALSQLRKMDVIPAKAGIQFLILSKYLKSWMLAFAGMTNYDTVSEREGQGSGEKGIFSLLPSPRGGEGKVLNNTMNGIAGIDIGGTAIKVGLVAGKGTIFSKNSIPYDPQKSF